MLSLLLREGKASDWEILSQPSAQNCNEGFPENTFHLMALMILWCALSDAAMLNITKEAVLLQLQFQWTFFCKNSVRLAFKG